MLYSNAKGLKRVGRKKGWKRKRRTIQLPPYFISLSLKETTLGGLSISWRSFDLERNVKTGSIGRYISQPWVKSGGKYRRCCLWISNIDALWSAVHGLLDESQGHTYINPDKNCNRLSFINMSTFNISMTFLLSVKICNNFFLV